MTSPLAWLAGLGAGAESLGSDLNQRELLRRAKDRQDAADALNLLKTVTPMGGQVLPQGQDPAAALARVTGRNNAVSGMLPDGSQSAIPNEATGMPDDTLPNQFGRPSLARVGNANVLIDPSQSVQAGIEKRGALAQAAALKKQQAEDAAKLGREEAGQKAQAQAATRAAQADYTTLQSLDPRHPLVQAPFNPDYAAAYTREVSAAHARQTAKDAYHAPTAEWMETSSVGPNGRVMLMNKVTGDRKEAPEGTPKPAGGIGGQSLSQDDRAKMVEQAKLDNATMKAYENKVMQHGTAPGTVAGLAGAAASTGGGGFANQALGIVGNAATGAIDPEYQRYITAQRSYGRIMGNLQSKRYTDHQAEIERSISGLQGNDLAGTIQYKQQLRDASLADPAVTPSQGGGKGGGGGTKTVTINGKEYHVP